MRTLRVEGEADFLAGLDADCRFNARDHAARAAGDIEQNFRAELLGNLEFLCFQAQAGNIPRELWLRWEEALKWWLTFPGVRACWEARPTPFTPTFTRCVERCLELGYRSERQEVWERFLAGMPEEER